MLQIKLLFRRRWFRYFAIYLLCNVITIVLFLLFLPPQYSRYVYLFRTYVYPGGEPDPLHPKFRYLYPDSDYTGVWYLWYANGTLASRAQYLNGKLNGKAFSWYSTGQLSFMGEFKNGNPVDIQTSWHVNGKKRSVGNYEDLDAAVNYEITWDDNGRLSKIRLILRSKNAHIFKYYSDYENTTAYFELDGKDVSEEVFKERVPECLRKLSEMEQKYALQQND